MRSPSLPRPRHREGQKVDQGLGGQEVVPRRQGAQAAGQRAQDGLQARRDDEAGVWRGGEEDTEAPQGPPYQPQSSFKISKFWLQLILSL